MKTNQTNTHSVQLDLFTQTDARRSAKPTRDEKYFVSAPKTPSKLTSPSPFFRSAKAQILVVEDLPCFLLGLEHVLNAQDDMTVCANCRPSEAVSAIADLNADAVVLNMTDPGHLDVVKAIVREHPELPILVYSMLDDVVFPERAIRAGAKGYVSKRQSTDAFPKSLRQLLCGNFAVTDDLREKIYAAYLGKPQHLTIADKLSDRELEVFYRIGLGRGTSQIAEQMSLSIKTIESHRAHLKEKLQVARAPELIRAAIKWVDALC